MMILTKNTTKGEAIVRLRSGDNEPVIELRVGGKYVGSWAIANATVSALATPIGSNTHALAMRLGLTAAEAQTIEAAKASARATYEALPEFTEKRLRSERHALACNVAGSLDSLSSHRERCYTEDCGFRGMDPYETAIKSAEAKLAEFDLAHPEVLAKIEAERAESAERNMWN